MKTNIPFSVALLSCVLLAMDLVIAAEFPAEVPGADKGVKLSDYSDTARESGLSMILQDSKSKDAAFPAALGSGDGGTAKGLELEEALREDMGLVAFFDKNTLFISSSATAGLLTMSGDQFQSLKSSLTLKKPATPGVEPPDSIDPMLTPEEFNASVMVVEDGKNYVVNGNHRLVELVSNVANALKGKQSAPRKFQRKVIRLNHAFAETVKFKADQDRTIEIPGVVDLLNKMVSFGDTALSAQLPGDGGSRSPASEQGGSSVGVAAETKNTLIQQQRGDVIQNNAPIAGFSEAAAALIEQRERLRLIDTATLVFDSSDQIPIEQAIKGAEENPQDIPILFKRLSAGQRRELFSKLNAETIQQFLGRNANGESQTEEQKKETESEAYIEAMKRSEEEITVSNVKRTILADPTQNSIILMDEPHNIRLYESIIRDLDKPINLVEISVAVMDMSVSNELDWRTNILAAAEGTVNDQKIFFLGGSNTGPSALGAPVTGTTPGLTTSLTGVSGLDASSLVVGESYRILSRIRALQEKGDLKVLSRPSLLTLDNTQAVISDDSVFHIRVPGDESAELFRIAAGLTVRIKPHIIEHLDLEGRHDEKQGRRIRLVIHIEDGSFVQDSLVDSIPETQKSFVTTQAILTENQSLLVAGRYDRAESNAEGRVPIAGRLPVIGIAFKDKFVSNRKRQRVFLITPKIIDPHQMHQSYADRATDVLDNKRSDKEAPKTQTDWNVVNEALTEDGFLPDEDSQEKRVLFPGIKRMIQRYRNDR